MTSLDQLPPWPEESDSTDVAEWRFDYIAALRARLELTTSAMYDICSDLESEYKARSAGAKDWNWLHEQWRIIEACTEPKP